MSLNYEPASVPCRESELDEDTEGEEDAIFEIFTIHEVAFFFFITLKPRVE